MRFPYYPESASVTPHDPGYPGNQAPSVALCAHIAVRFEQLNLPHWTAVVLSWMARYDGISRCYFEDVEPSPHLQVLRCISEISPGISDADVADALSRLEFLSWRIRHPETEERWDPLSISLAHFIGSDGLPNCWKWEGAYPSSPDIAAWLIAQLTQHSEP